MIDTSNKEDCCGCGICALLCPRDAITMIQDEEGFFYPIINEIKCIKCEICLKNCAFRFERKKLVARGDERHG